MGFLTPDDTYTTSNGVTVHRKFLPEKQRPNKHLNTPDGNPLWVTIHNTEDINEAAGTNDAEQYARATFNGNMGDVTVHFYIDETDCWQILPMNEIGYHAGDYADKNGGNRTSVAIEIIEKNGRTDDDKKAEDRGAKLAAWILFRYGLSIDRLTTHQHWNGKYCPAYILPHWDAFKATAEQYLKELNAPQEQAKPSAANRYYRVQVGYFGSYDNAVRMKELLNKAGFDAIIKEEPV